MCTWRMLCKGYFGRREQVHHPQYSARPPRDYPQSRSLLDLIAWMWIGNLLLVILNLPLIGIWVRLLRIPTGCSILGYGLR